MFEFEHEKYVLDYRNLFFCELDASTHETLTNMLNNPEYNSESREFSILEALAQSGFFMSQTPDAPVPNHRYDTLNISFAPIHSCNFACTYCYADGRKDAEGILNFFDEETIDKMLNHIYVDKYPGYRSYKFDFVSGP